MAKLTTAQRNAFASNQFALQKLRKYPIDTDKRARSALAYSSQYVKKGNITTAQHKTIIDAVKFRYPKMNVKATPGKKLSLKAKNVVKPKPMMKKRK